MILGNTVVIWKAAKVQLKKNEEIENGELLLIGTQNSLFYRVIRKKIPSLKKNHCRFI